MSMANSTSSFSVPTGASNEIRLILLGKTGAGKSSFGNTILGEEIFEAETSPTSVTSKCAIGSRLFLGKQIFAIDTPGFLDNTVTNAIIQAEVAKSYQMAATPGPHAFLFVIEPHRFLPEDAEAIKYLEKIFG